MAEANPKKPIYKEIWFWAVILILVFGIMIFMESPGFRRPRREIRREFRNMFPPQQIEKHPAL